MGSEIGVMSNTAGLAERLRRLLCTSGGSMELGQLGRSLGLNEQQMARLLEVEEGRSLVIREQGEGERVAVYRSNVRLCSERTQTCIGGCGKLHMCRYFILGSCSRSPCKFNHCIQTAQDLLVIQEHQLSTLSITELRQLLLQNDPGLLPDVCLHYNRGDGHHGSCTFKSNCNKLHVCQHFLQGDCKFGNICKRSHNLSEEETMRKLMKWGLRPNFLPGLLVTYLNANAIRNSSVTSPRKEVTAPKQQETAGSPGTATAQPTEEICLYFIRNSCSFNDKCVRDHYHLPYRWQMCINGVWKDFDNMEAIEKAYCDPNNRLRIVDMNFDTMTFKSYKVKRLSTPSSASKPPHFILTTDWLWYWLDENYRWIQYGKENDLHAASIITSLDLENVYLSDATASIPFKAGKHEYILSFKEMVQRNVRYHTERRVCRRPVFVSAEDVKKKKSRNPEAAKGDDKSIPAHWDRGQVPDTGYTLVPLVQSMDEYSKVEAMFKRTLPSMTVLSIQRIQNPALWEVYQWQKDQMKKQNGGKDVDERQLFHGTNDSLIDAICQQNFDWRICGAHGTAFGKGSYFARDSAYSHNYARSSISRTRVMFVARVLVGDFIHGKSSYLRPPSKSASSSFYDSCVDSEISPSIFVIFEKHQIYPEYLIKYSDDPGDLNGLLSALKRGRI
ncbi:protein mono-ADP-ribosyltransferase PARP12-like [Rhinophrynus dorsalis]